MPEPIEIKYRAFISYSHVDARWAEWLHRSIEAFRIDKDIVGRVTATGPIPNSLRPIFRDRDEFTAGHTIDELTRSAIEASAALIVLCSPAAVASRYVDLEIRLFKSRCPGRPVIPYRRWQAGESAIGMSTGCTPSQGGSGRIRSGPRRKKSSPAISARAATAASWCWPRFWPGSWGSTQMMCSAAPGARKREPAAIATSSPPASAAFSWLPRSAA